MKNIIRGLKSIIIFAFTFVLLGCDEEDVVLPELTAGFTYTINQDTGTVSFINTSTNADSYEWDLAYGPNSTLINPIRTYPSGIYTVVLTATNVAGASDTFEDTFTIAIPEEIAIPITFDNPLVNYDATVFNGTSFQIVENPDATGANPMVSNVGEIVNIGEAFEGFFFELGQPLDLSTEKTVKALFWSTTPVNILLKLENGTAGDVEVIASHLGTGWEEIYFTFDSAANYSTITFFVDGPGTTAGTFYIDEITQINTSDIPCTDTDLELPIDFDCETIDYATAIVGNVNFTVIDNPELSGINDVASMVGEITNAGDNFENAFFNFDVPVDFSTDKGIRLKLFSNQALPILLKFEDGTEADVENSQMHTGTGWEELTFTLNSNGSYNDMVLFVAFNQINAGTFYVDDIEQVSVSTGPPCIAETSESIAAADLNISFQTDSPAVIDDNVAFSYIDNPDATGANTSCRVGQVQRFNNSPFDNVQIDLSNKLDFNSSEGMKMKVWSPIANTPVLLKLEEIGSPGNFVEILQNTGVANTWTELTYDFPATATPQFNKIVIFFNFNVADGSTYYFDDLMVYGTPGGGGGGGGSCPAPPAGDFIADGDFESNTGCWLLFDSNTGNGGTTTISTTVSNGGGNNSGQIETAPFGNPGLKQERFGVGSILPNTNYILNFDIKSDANNQLDGAAFQAFTFSEPADGSGLPATQHILVTGDTNVSTSWTSRTYTFTTGGNVDGGLSLLFELVCGGPPCSGTINIDNVSITAQ